MTEQTNADLIAEARAAVEGHAPNESEVLSYRLAERLEAAEKGWDADVQRLAEAHNARLAVEQRVAELAAVVEKVRAYAESVPRTRDRDVNPGLSNRSWLTAQDVLGILAPADADALRELKADVWDEGWSAAGAWQIAAPGTPYPWNPYRQAKRVLMTHPHDGHDLGDTCLDCLRREEQS